MKRNGTRRLLFAIPIAAVIFAALLALGVLVFDRSFGYRAEQTLYTALALGAFSLIALACVWAWERDTRKAVALLGIVIGALVAGCAIVGVWWGFDFELQTRERLARVTVVGIVWAICLALFCLLGLARVRRSWLWVLIGTQCTLALLALLVTGVAIGGNDPDENFLRGISILGVLTLGGVIATPVLHRLSIMPAESRSSVTTALQLTLTCPRCETPQKLSAGHSNCAQCGLRFYIEIEEEHCTKCGYPLYGITSAQCPECGTLVLPPAEPAVREKVTT